MEQFGQIKENNKKFDEKIDQMEEKIIETLNNKIEGNNEALKQQINEKMEEHSNTLRKN